MMTGETAVRQAWKTACEYAQNSQHELLSMLDIDRGKPDWQKTLAPFAAVWAAMITAAAADFHSAVTMERISE